MPDRKHKWRKLVPIMLRWQSLPPNYVTHAKRLFFDATSSLNVNSNEGGQTHTKHQRVDIFSTVHELGRRRQTKMMITSGFWTKITLSSAEYARKSVIGKNDQHPANKPTAIKPMLPGLNRENGIFYSKGQIHRGMIKNEFTGCQPKHPQSTCKKWKHDYRTCSMKSWRNAAERYGRWRRAQKTIDATRECRRT